MIEGLSHITFVVRDLDVMEHILTTVLGARRVYDSGAGSFSLSRERFFQVGPDTAEYWIAIMEGDALPTQTYNHTAFKIADNDYDTYLARVTSLGLSVREGRPRVEGEGRSIYFHDADNHLFELHTGTLPERLARYTQASKI
jgi:fosfomycin resistance protein FosX